MKINSVKKMHFAFPPFGDPNRTHFDPHRFVCMCCPSGARVRCGAMNILLAKINERSVVRERRLNRREQQSEREEGGCNDSCVSIKNVRSVGSLDGSRSSNKRRPRRRILHVFGAVRALPARQNCFGYVDRTQRTTLSISVLAAVRRNFWHDNITFGRALVLFFQLQTRWGEIYCHSNSPHLR